MEKSDLTEIIINRFFKVYTYLGFGFLEKVYQNALALELERAGLKVELQKDILVYYQDTIVGAYVADIVVNDCIILELKAVEEFSDAHIRQIKNYLKASRMEIGLLMNFGKKPEFKRCYYSNQNKAFTITEESSI